MQATHAGLVSFIAKQILFPLEPCIFFEKKAETWIAPLTVDAAFLHTMIFIAQSYFDVFAPDRRSALTKKTSSHLLKGLKLLRERIAHDNDRMTLSDTTTATIMALTCHAILTKDFKSALNHVEGLKRIVNLRGGITSFRSNAKLLIDILRYESIILKSNYMTRRC
jgi:hypothetical protein